MEGGAFAVCEEVEWILWRSFFSSGKRRVAEVGIFFRSRRQIWVRIVALQVMIIYN